MATSIEILCLDGRKVNIKTSVNTKLVKVLEEVCTKKNCLPSVNYELRRYNTKKSLDLALTLRFAGLSNNAKLELVKAAKAGESSIITIALQVESGERLQHDFHSDTLLWGILEHWRTQGSANLLESPEGQNPVCVYMREEVQGEFALKNTTLYDMGLKSGRAVIRLGHKQIDEETLAAIKEKITLAKAAFTPENIPTANKPTVTEADKPGSKQANKSPDMNAETGNKCGEKSKPNSAVDADAKSGDATDAKAVTAASDMDSIFSKPTDNVAPVTSKKLEDPIATVPVSEVQGTEIPDTSAVKPTKSVDPVSSTSKSEADNTALNTENIYTDTDQLEDHDMDSEGNDQDGEFIVESEFRDSGNEITDQEEDPNHSFDQSGVPDDEQKQTDEEIEHRPKKDGARESAISGTSLREAVSSKAKPSYKTANIRNAHRGHRSTAEPMTLKNFKFPEETKGMNLLDRDYMSTHGEADSKGSKHESDDGGGYWDRRQPSSPDNDEDEVGYWDGKVCSKEPSGRGSGSDWTSGTGWTRTARGTLVRKDVSKRGSNNVNQYATDVRLSTTEHGMITQEEFGMTERGTAFREETSLRGRGKTRAHPGFRKRPAYQGLSWKYEDGEPPQKQSWESRDWESSRGWESSSRGRASSSRGWESSSMDWESSSRGRASSSRGWESSSSGRGSSSRGRGSSSRGWGSSTRGWESSRDQNSRSRGSFRGQRGYPLHGQSASEASPKNAYYRDSKAIYHKGS